MIIKFLLIAINAKFIHSNPAIYTLCAYAAEKYASNIELAEYTINQQTEEILANIYERKPDAIGFSCYIWNWNIVCKLLDDLPKVLPETDIWLGGPEVSYNAEKVLGRFPQVKGIMIGEGEATFCELMDRYQGHETGDLSNVAGLFLRSGATPAREVMDLNRVPFPYRDTKPFVNRILYYESSRGCPYRCSYCLSSIEKTLRLRDMELVTKDLSFFLAEKVKQVKFVDRTFNCVHEHAMAIWKYIYEHDNGVTNFHFEIAADILTDEEIELLKKFRPGQVQLEIGVQTINQKTLEAINRSMNLERLEYVVSELRSNRNINLHLDLIAGLPYEDYESFKKSFDRVYAMQPDDLQLGFLKVLSGSPIALKTEEFGILYTEQPPYEVLSTKWLSYDDVIRLKKVEEMVEMYYNSSQFQNTLDLLARVFGSPFKMFEELADYFERKGFLVNSPSRAYRYEILLDFASEKDRDNREIYRELLTYDLYLRENMKSRPGFCRSLANEEYKKVRNDFYKEEEKTRHFLPELKYDSRKLSGMTHFEPFKFPVWDKKLLLELINMGISVRSGKKYTYVLFDYTRKELLTKNALTIVTD